MSEYRNNADFWFHEYARLSRENTGLKEDLKKAFRCLEDTKLIGRIRGCLYSMQYELDGRHDDDDTEDLKSEIKQLLKETQLTSPEDE